MKIAIIDFETTGLDPDFEEAIELYIHLWTPEQGLLPVPEGPLTLTDDAFYRLWFPQGPVAPKAQDVNKFTLLSWKERGAQFLTCEDMYALNSWIQHKAPDMWCGAATSFDTNFLKSTYQRVRVQPAKMTHRISCVQALASPLLFTGELKSVSLESLCKHFGIANKAPHTSRGDVWATAEVLEALCGRYLRVA